MSRMGVTCSHCHEVNYEGERYWPYCTECGHRADIPRAQCDCDRCQHMRDNLQREDE
jgi:hypothetical protein